MRENLLKHFEGVARLDLSPNEGENKVMSLEEAIRRNVEPGMTLYVREGSYAALREIMRQFWGKKPGFTLVMVGCRDYALDLIHCGLLSKVMAARCSESPTQGVSSVIRRAYKNKAVNIESWSLYSLTLRLMAGAMRVGFLPTRSLLDSTMAQENRDSFMEMDDPFGRGDKIGVVKSLNADLAMVHGWAADAHGNLILGPAILSGEGEWGALGSQKGIIATVEKIVSTEFIREHSSLVSVPAYFVKSVSVVPFGAHPLGLASLTSDFDEYEADYEFMTGRAKASKEPETLDAWLKEWVLGCPHQDDYLRKLGYPRLAFLKGKAGRFNWEHKLLSLREEDLTGPDCNSEERMIIAASRLIKEKVAKNGYPVILAGIGTGGLAAWLAYYQLKKVGVDIELMLGSSCYGWAPRPGDPQVTNFSNLRACKMITDIVHTYGIFAQKSCLSVLGAAQVDKYGNLNSTRLSEDFYLTGSGGANDGVAASTETIVALAQSKKRFVNELPYTTCCGKKTTTVISDKGIFEKISPDNELLLTAYFPEPGKSDQGSTVRAIKEDCGWDLKVHPNLREVEPPDTKELALLRVLSSKAV